MKEGWRMVKLGEVCDRFGEYGMSVSSKPYDGIRYIRITDITDDGNLNDDYVSADINYIDDDYRLQKGDVLFARTGATVGKTLVYKEKFGECVYAGYLIRYRPNLSLVLPQFLFYCTHYQEYYNWVKNNQKAAAQPNISAKLYNGYEFPLPPLEEQHRIVSILDASFEKIDALKKNAEENLKNAKALFQQVLAQELKPKEGWVEKKMGEVCDCITDFVAAGSFADLRKNVVYKEESDYAQLVRTTDLKNDFKNKSFVFINEEAFKYLWRVNLNKESIILPNVGVNCGEIYYVEPKDLPYPNNVLGPNAVLVRSNCENNKFLSYYFKGNAFQKLLNDITSTMAQPKFNKTNLKQLLVSFPTDIEEQHRIVRTLDTLSEKCRRLEQVAQQTIRECDALKQSILRQAFSGEL